MGELATAGITDLLEGLTQNFVRAAETSLPLPTAPSAEGKRAQLADILSRNRT